MARHRGRKGAADGWGRVGRGCCGRTVRTTGRLASADRDWDSPRPDCSTGPAGRGARSGRCGMDVDHILDPHGRLYSHAGGARFGYRSPAGERAVDDVVMRVRRHNEQRYPVLRSVLANTPRITLRRRRSRWAGRTTPRTRWLSSRFTRPGLRKVHLWPVTTGELTPRLNAA